MQFFAGFEPNRLARRDINHRSGPRIASDTSLAGPHIEDAKASQLNAVTTSQRLLQALKHRVYSCFRLVARQAGAFNDVMNNVLFYQRLPSLLQGFFYTCFRLARIVEMFPPIVNVPDVT